MEIVTLSFRVTEDELNSLLVRFFRVPPKIRDLHLRVMPDGLLVAGVYATVLPIPFETEWRIFVVNGSITARLAAIKCVGIRLNFLKGYILNTLNTNTTILVVDDESLVFHLDRFLENMTIPLKTNLRSVCCESGRLMIECGGA